MVDSLKALDPEWPIREADIRKPPINVRFRGECVAKLSLRRLTNNDSVGMRLNTSGAAHDGSGEARTRAVLLCV
jgi:hypothetical protein